jgi:uncharacterized membrane protein
MRYSGSLDIVLAIAVALITMALAFTGVQLGIVQAVLGALFVLVVPGYTLTAAFLWRRDPGIARRLTLSIGLSMAVSIIGGFILHWLPGGLSPVSWAVLLGGVSLAGGVVALVRRGHADEEALTPEKAPASPEPRTITVNLRDVALFALAAFVLVAAFWVARNGALNQDQPGFTQLWLTWAPDAGPYTAAVGVRNEESRTYSYRLRVEEDGEVLLSEPLIELAPGEHWETTVNLPAGPESGKVTALLYRLDAPQTVHRRATLSREIG